MNVSLLSNHVLTRHTYSQSFHFIECDANNVSDYELLCYVVSLWLQINESLKNALTNPTFSDLPRTIRYRSDHHTLVSFD